MRGLGAWQPAAHSGRAAASRTEAMGLLAQAGAKDHELLSTLLRCFPHLETHLQGVPAGEDPFRFRVAEVERAFEGVSILPNFSIPLPGGKNAPVWQEGKMVGVDVDENLHSYALASAVDGAGVEAANQAAEPRSGSVRVSWRPIPHAYVAAPERQPPLTPYDLARPQRFELRNGRFRFFHAKDAAFTGFGTGRTFPTIYADQPIVPVGAIVEVQQGYGQLAGLFGLVMINGKVSPPSTMHLSITPAFLDFDHRLQSVSEVDAILQLPNPDPTSTYLMLSTVSGPHRWLDNTRLMKDGMVALGGRSEFPLRSGDLSFSIRNGNLVSHRRLGRVVGSVRGHFFLGPWQVAGPMPMQGRDSRHTIHNGKGKVAGRIWSNIVEGRMFEIEVPHAIAPGWFSGGVGPITGGDGIFAGVTGQVSSLTLSSIFPLTEMSIELIRLDDSDGLYRRAVQRAWRQG